MTVAEVEFTPAVRRRWCELLGLMYYPEWDDILGSPAREVAIFGGVRGSKSTVDALKVWFHPLFHAPAEALYWIVGGTYKAAEKEATYLYQWATMCGLVKSASMPDRDSWRIVLANGTVIETRSSEHPERLASDAPDLILVVEAGQQKERVRKAARERALQRGAQIYYSGTFEDEDNHQTWKWFEDLDEEFGENNGDHAKFSLPSWTNRHEFPAGEADPKIVWARENEDEYTFSRKYGGRPGGAQFAIYRAIQFNDDRLQPLPEHLKRQGSWLFHLGGTDYGTVHPSALVVASISTDKVRLMGPLLLRQRPGPFDENVIWIRECWWDGDRPEASGDRGDPRILKLERRRLETAYPGLHRWITDPNERFQSKDWFGQAAATGAGSREGRIALVRSRHVNGTLMYDRDGPGVERLYRESQAVRYKVMPDGQKVPLRLDDDQTAAKENAIWGIDTRPPAPPRSARTVRPAPVPAGRGSYPRV